jgi:asparagine synthetase B (glutamine-hydrolysing)
MFVAWNCSLTQEDSARHWPGLERLTARGEELGVAARADAQLTHVRRGAVVAVCVAPPWGPDAAAVAEAYRVAGANLARDLPGEFSAVVLDHDTNALLATSAMTALPPLAFVVTPDGTFVSSHVLELARHPQASRALDETYLAHMVTGFVRPPPGTSAVRGIRRLAAGEALVVRRGVPSLLRVDRLTARRSATARTWAEARDVFWDALGAAVDRRTPPNVRACLALSGGLDSVAVAVALRRRGRALPVASMVADGLPDERDALGAVQAALDLRAVTHVDCRHAVDPRQLDELPLSDDALLAPLPRFPAFVRLARTMRAAGFDTIVHGDGGDEVFHVGAGPALGGRRLGAALREMVDRKAARALASRVPLLARLPSTARAWWYARRARRAGQLPSYLVKSRETDALVADAVAAWSEAEAPRTMLDGVQTWLSSPILMGSRAALDRLLEAAGLRATSPFVDRDLIERVAGLSDAWVPAMALDKPLLRRGLEGAIPEDVRLQRKDVRFVRALLVEMVGSPSTREALADRELRRRLEGWVNFAEVERLASEIRRGRDPSWAVLGQFDCLVSFAHWYRRAQREHGVR